MGKKKNDNRSVDMAEAKQVTSSSRTFWFPDGDRVEATTAMEAAQIKKSKTT